MRLFYGPYPLIGYGSVGMKVRDAVCVLVDHRYGKLGSDGYGRCLRCLTIVSRDETAGGECKRSDIRLAASGGRLVDRSVEGKMNNRRRQQC